LPPFENESSYKHFSYEHEFDLHELADELVDETQLISSEWFRSNIRFDRAAKSNSEMA